METSPGRTDGQVQPAVRRNPTLDRRRVERELWGAFNESDITLQRVRIREVVSMTGESSDAWTVPARQAFDAWFTHAGAAPGVAEVRDIGCYQHGCIATVRFGGMEAYDSFSESMVTFEGISERWDSPVVRSSPEIRSDGVFVEWVLIRPESE